MNKLTFIFENHVTGDTHIVKAWTESEAWIELRKIIKGPNINWNLKGAQG